MTTHEPTKRTRDLADPYALDPQGPPEPAHSLRGQAEIPPKIAKRGWMAWLVLLMFVQFLVSQAGVISASAFAFSTLLPIGDDPYSSLSIGTWVATLVVIAIAIHVVNKYTIVERVSTALVFLATVFAVVMVFLLRTTDFSWTVGDLAGGMRLQIALGAIGVALSMFGLTGVGAGEITAYTYWCVEKKGMPPGPVRTTGPRTGSSGRGAGSR